MSEQQLADPYLLHLEDVQQPPSTFKGILRKIGPGLVLAVGIVGSGELIVTTTLGAENGYTLLWLILVSCSIKMVVQNELGRHTMSTGETTFEAFNHAPGPRLRVSWLVWLCLGLFVPICSATGAMLGAVAEILHRIVPVFSIDLLVWVVGVTTAVLLMVSGYAVVEKIALAFIVTFTGVTISCAYLLSYKPEYFSWASVADGLSFHMPETGFVTAVAVFGITGAGTMDLIAYPYWCVEKGYGRFAGPRDNSEAWRQRARGWIRVMGADIIASMVAYTIPTLAFYLLGAGILHTMGVVPAGSEMVGTLSNIYTQILGDWSLYLFLVGAFAILYSTIFSGTMALGLVFADFLRVVGLFNRNNYRARRKAIRATMFVILFLSALFFSFLQDPVVMLKIGGFMYALMLPVVGFVTIYLSSKHTPKAVLPSGWITLALWLTAVLMAIMMGYSVMQQLNL